MSYKPLFSEKNVLVVFGEDFVYWFAVIQPCKMLFHSEIDMNECIPIFFTATTTDLSHRPDITAIMQFGYKYIYWNWLSVNNFKYFFEITSQFMSNRVQYPEYLNELR